MCVVNVTTSSPERTVTLVCVRADLALLYRWISPSVGHAPDTAFVARDAATNAHVPSEEYRLPDGRPLPAA